jgi:hypothetical protein
MIRGAVLHLENEQPLLGDLYRLPEPTDVGLLCTNVRMLDGKRPIFIDHPDSAFFFPYRIIRFIEMPPGSFVEPGQDPTAEDAVPQTGLVPTNGHDHEAEAELELDEDFLRRVREI